MHANREIFHKSLIKDKMNCVIVFGEKGGEKRMNKKILGIFIAVLAVAMLATPVLAVGPKKTEGKNPHVEIHGFNTQMWLPSGVMNEWIENPAYPGPIVVTVKDAAKFQIKNAYVIDNASDIGMIFGMENQWVKLSQEALAAFLFAVGFPPDGAEDFPDGIYIQMVYVGWSPEDLPPPP